MRRRVRSLAFGTVLIVGAVAGLLSTPAAHADVLGLSRQSVNAVVKLSDNHCRVEYAFGTFDGVAYAQMRMVRPDAGYFCIVRSRAVAARGASIMNCPWSKWSLNGQGPPTGTQVPSTDWQQSRLFNAVGFAAQFEISAYRGATGRVDQISVSAY